MELKHVVYISLSDVIEFIITTENIQIMRNLLKKYFISFVNKTDDFLDSELSENFEDILFNNGISKNTMLQNVKNLVDDCDEWYLMLKIGYGGHFVITDECDYQSYDKDDIMNALNGCSDEFTEVSQIFKNIKKKIIFEPY